MKLLPSAKRLTGAWRALIVTALGFAWNALAAPYEWTWQSGSNVAGGTPVYGTKGVAAAANTPATGGIAGRDSTGKIWLYSNSNVWRYDPVTGNWTWLNGGGATAPAANWGTKGVEAPSNFPGGRTGLGGVWDKNGRLWLFGGLYSPAGGGIMSDLWRYDGATNQWTWMTGPTTIAGVGIYGVRNVPAATNLPGEHANSMARVDPQGRIVFFGGAGFSAMSDIWRYDPATNWWAWLGGATSRNIPGIAGTKGVPSSSNRIGGRQWGSAVWLTDDGLIWIFGGYGLDASTSGIGTYQNDLWRFNPVTNEWTWMTGDTVVPYLTSSYIQGVYGTKGVPAAANNPGSRSNPAEWIDPHGDLWMMGGSGADATGPNNTGTLNDVWRFSPATGQWTWMAGSDTRNPFAVFGTKGIAAVANAPSGVESNTNPYWSDPSGTLNLISGGGSADIWSFALPAEPELRVTGNGADVLDSGSFTVNDAAMGSTSQTILTITNTGSAALTGLAASLSGAAGDDFSLEGPLVTSLAPGATTTITISFTPSVFAVRTASLSITSNDADENPYDIALSGSPSAPEIVVEQPVGTDLTDGSATITFPTTNLGSTSAAKTFTIRNTGIGGLTGISVTKDGAHGADFIVSTSPSIIPPGASATFTVVFSPTSGGGSRSAAIHIASNDADENPFDIALTGTSNAPEIEVEHPVGTGLTDGVSTIDYGPVQVGSSLMHTFTIRNSGPLSLTGLSLGKAGADSASFTLGALSVSSLAPGASTTFTVTFAPGIGGPQNALLTITSDDFDENPFDIDLTGIGLAPEIVIEQPLATNLTDGGSTVDFAATNVGASAVETFTVRNVGNGPLTGLSLSSIGPDTSHFLLGALSTNSLNPGESTTFDVTFAPQSYGSRSASLRVASNDSDENPFDINLTGTGLAPDIVIEQPVLTNIGDGEGRSFGSIALGTSANLTFTIKNVGNIDLTDLGITKDGTHAGDFTVTASPVAPVSSPGGSTTFTVQFIPSAIGTRTAGLHIASNDSDETPFDIVLSGIGSGPDIGVEHPVGTPLVSAISTVTLPPSSVGIGSTQAVITLRNTGNSPLTTSFAKDGANSGEFTLSNVGTILGGTSEDLTVTFKPRSTGARTADLHVTSNDPDESPFHIHLTGVGSAPQPGAVDLGFDLNTNAAHFLGLCVQPDGKTLLGGYFSEIKGVSRARIARLLPGGNLDTSFDPGANGGVRCFGIQSDGKIIVGGEFSNIGGSDRNYLARLHADGTVDLSFDPNSGGHIHTLALQADGKILVGGLFSSIGGVPRNYLARLNTDGSVDAGFDPNPSSNVGMIKVLENGEMLVGGSFSTIGGLSRTNLARLNVDGTADAAFNANVAGTVYDAVIQPDNKVVICGYISNVHGAARGGIARVDADGSLDASFNPGADNFVMNLQLQADGKIIAAGGFSNIGSSVRSRMAKLNIDGTLDTTFVPEFVSSVYTLCMQSDGRLITAGAFYEVNGFPFSIARIENGPATDQLSVPTASQVRWLRGGTAPETHRVTFDLSTDGGNTWAPLGVGTRVTGGWEINALSLPPTGHVRATAQLSAGGFQNGSHTMSQTAIPYSLVATQATIVIEQPTNVPLTSGVSSIDFGELPPGSPIARTFRIRNTGVDPLTGITVSTSGLHAANFTPSAPGATTLAPGTSTTVSVTFNPVDGGYKSATLNVFSNAANVSNFTVTLTGGGLGPEIGVSTPDISDVFGLPPGPPPVVLMDGVGSKAFGAVRPGMVSSLTRTFTIHSQGILDLESLALSVSGAAASDFSFTPLTVTTLAPGAETTFAVTFTPSATGIRAATLHISSNDSNESSFDIGVTGLGSTNLDMWRTFHFTGHIDDGNLTYSVNDYEDDKDPDHDGINNLMEFALGTYPTQNSPAPQSFTRSTGGQLTYTYQRLKTALTDGVTFMVQHNASLNPAGWSSDGITESILSDDGTIQVIEATIPAPAGDTCFVRLRVSR